MSNQWQVTPHYSAVFVVSIMCPHHLPVVHTVQLYDHPILLMTLRAVFTAQVCRGWQCSMQLCMWVCCLTCSGEESRGVQWGCLKHYHQAAAANPTLHGIAAAAAACCAVPHQPLEHTSRKLQHECKRYPPEPQQGGAAYMCPMASTPVA